MANPTRELYDRTATHWVRRGPSSLSDFTARPAVLDLCEPLAGRRVLDLGCGEGYCTRQLRRRGARDVQGVDLSESMIRSAEAQEAMEPLGIHYSQGCATDLARFEDGAFDLVVAVFLFNYLSTEQTVRCMKEVRRVLRPDGAFVFSVPHPAFPFLRGAEPPFYFQVGQATYFGGQDTLFPGRIWKMDGSFLEVQLVHKTLEDYFTAMNEAGLRGMPRLRELRVTRDLVDVAPDFFGPLLDIPLHLAVKVQP